MNAPRYYTIIIHHVAWRCFWIIVKFCKDRYWDTFLVNFVFVAFHCESFSRPRLSIGKYSSVVPLYDNSSNE